MSRPWGSPYLIKKKWTFGRVTVGFDARSTEGFMGRFGGGWNWKLGFQASTIPRPSGTVIISLLIADLRVDWSKPTAKESA